MKPQPIIPLAGNALAPNTHGRGGDGVSSVRGDSLYDILFEKAEREEGIIREMAAAVSAGDRNRVFELARELTCVTSNQK